MLNSRKSRISDCQHAEEEDILLSNLSADNVVSIEKDLTLVATTPQAIERTVQGDEISCHPIPQRDGSSSETQGTEQEPSHRRYGFSERYLPEYITDRLSLIHVSRCTRSLNVPDSISPRDFCMTRSLIV